MVYVVVGGGTKIHMCGCGYNVGNGGGGGVGWLAMMVVVEHL